MLRTFCFATSLLAALASTGRAQNAYAYSFTSGATPIGDGNQYPRSLNPARQASGTGGATTTTYFGAGSMGFVNVSGNPAFFDANNLLTRPSRLMSGEAFWTDPKFGNFLFEGSPFAIANFGLSLGSIEEADFGFDVAVASVSGPVSGGADVPYISFQVQDAADFIAVGTMFFGSAPEATNANVEGSLVDRFQTLSSPHPGFEGRFDFSNARLKEMIREQNPSATGDAEVLYFDMRMGNYTSNGGTTQFAVDNVVYGGAARPDPRNEPNYVPPAGRIGENTPQYFGYIDALPEDYDGDTYDLKIKEIATAGNPVTVVSTQGEQPGVDLSARAYTQGSNLAFEGVDAAGEPTLAAHEMTYVSQQRLQTVPEEQTPIGGSLGVNQVPLPAAPDRRASNPDRHASNDVALAVAGVTQGIELTTVLAYGASSPELQAAFAAAAAQEADLSQRVVSMAGDDFTRFTLTQDLLLSFDDVRPGAPDRTGTPADPAAVDPAASFYYNFSLAQYLDLKATAGEPMFLGDSGSIVSPYFDAAGDVLSYAVSTWRVTDQSGVFVPVFINVPEPATFASLALVGAFAGRRRRA